MRHIKTFDYRKYKEADAPITREAARAVILDGNSLLMVRLAKTDEYKFPGGGVDSGEDYHEALAREMSEEAGVIIKDVKQCLGYVDQIYPDIYNQETTFYLRSIYYLVEIETSTTQPNLSSSEQALGFEPEWVDIDKAIETNKKRMAKGTKYHWTSRELFMLEYIRSNILKRG